MAISVTINATTKVATVSVTVDITQILLDTANIADAADKLRQRKLLIAQATMQQLGEGRKALRKTDAELDAEVAAVQSEVAALKALRP